MNRLQTQGESTLHSWEKMMSQYTSLWTKPFFLILVTAILTGTMVSLISSYIIYKK
ncbi:MAG: hypothetical protein K2X39_08450 [Silvanigrellaceae bacterium]|nr:hypothetical protein [Silvanigrellaceae bacterium]